jgi:anti-sigma factor RsiW
MTDCPNGDVRDVLPEYLHDRLGASERARVDQHLASCDACRAELALLSDLRASLRRAPSVNTAAIAASIAPYRAPSRPAWNRWRAAAAVAAIAIAAASLMLAGRERTSTANSQRVAVAPPSESIGTAPSTHASPAPTAPGAPDIARATPRPSRPDAPPTPNAEPVSLAMTGHALGDLSDRELSALLQEIETLDGVPSEDVESAGALTAGVPLERGR